MNVEAMLRDLEPAWPETPDLAAAVAARVAAEAPAPRRRMARLPRRPAVVLAAVLLLGGGSAYAAIPSLRDFVRDLFGGTVEVRQVPRLPRVPPGATLGLGPPVSLTSAERRTGFEPVFPRALAEPEFHATGRQFAAVSGGLLFTAFRGDLPGVLVEKLVAGGTGVERVEVAGGRGLWITGRPHGFFYRDPDGEIREETLRLAGNTLIWARGPLVLRLEGAPSVAEARRIAATVR